MVRGINQPVEFERPLYQASIKENHRPGHPIINVIFNGSLPSYEFVPQDNACWKDFDINRKTGLVTNKVNITLLLTFSVNLLRKGSICFNLTVCYMLKIFRVHSSSFCERDAIIIWYAADERISSLEVIKLTLQQLFNASQYA